MDLEIRKKWRIGQNLGRFFSRPRKILEAMIVGAVMACYDKHIYEIRIGKGGGHSWVSRSVVGFSRYFSSGVSNAYGMFLTTKRFQDVYDTTDSKRS